MNAIGLNILDIGVLAIMAYFVVRALMRGLVREVLGLLGIVGALFAVALGYAPLSAFLHQLSGEQSFLWDALALTLILVVVFVAFSYLGHVLARLVHSGPFSFLDRLAGGAIGLVKGVLVCYLLLNILLVTLSFHMPDMFRESRLAPRVISMGRTVVDLVPDDIARKMQDKAGLFKPSSPKTPEKKK